jgi:hypothetical protein
VYQIFQEAIMKWTMIKMFINYQVKMKLIRKYEMASYETTYLSFITAPLQNRKPLWQFNNYNWLQVA